VPNGHVQTQTQTQDQTQAQAQAQALTEKGVHQQLDLHTYKNLLFFTIHKRKSNLPQLNLMLIFTYIHTCVHACMNTSAQIMH
jgi:hypothetical protein